MNVIKMFEISSIFWDFLDVAINIFLSKCLGFQSSIHREIQGRWMIEGFLVLGMEPDIDFSILFQNLIMLNLSCAFFLLCLQVSFLSLRVVLILILKFIDHSWFMFLTVDTHTIFTIKSPTMEWTFDAWFPLNLSTYSKISTHMSTECIKSIRNFILSSK